MTIFLVCAQITLLAQTHRVKVNKIWDNGSHSAFTSLIKFKGDYYCSFREGESHVFDKEGKAEGKVRIIKSSDGVNWESVALLDKSGYDLRDPKLSITPTGKLMVIIGGSIYEERKLTGRVPQVSFSEDGRVFTDPTPVRINDSAGNGTDWIWRVTWEGEVGYTAMYSLIDNDEAKLCLLSTKDGVHFDLVTQFDIPGFPNEATVRFDAKGDMLMMVRRERGNQKGYWGKSSAPFTEWTWGEMDMRLGGPDFIPLEDGVVVMGTRSHYTSFPKTVLLTGNGSEKFQEVYVLPSGGDTSYPGFIVEGDQLWVSYYSTHETPLASVYLAKIPLDIFYLK
jgi:hypothetical protein